MSLASGRSRTFRRAAGRTTHISTSKALFRRRAMEPAAPAGTQAGRGARGRKFTLKPQEPGKDPPRDALSIAARPGPPPISGPGSSAFVVAGADVVGGFGLDQLQHHQPDGLPDLVNAFPGSERLQQQMRQTWTTRSLGTSW